MALGTLRWLGAGDTPLSVATGAPATLDEPGRHDRRPGAPPRRRRRRRAQDRRPSRGRRCTQRLVLANLFDTAVDAAARRP
jgi:hypothetical protein